MYKMAKEDHVKDHRHWDNWKNNVQKFKHLEAADVNPDPVSGKQEYLHLAL